MSSRHHHPRSSGGAADAFILAFVRTLLAIAVVALALSYLARAG